MLTKRWAEMTLEQKLYLTITCDVRYINSPQFDHSPRWIFTKYCILALVTYFWNRLQVLVTSNLSNMIRWELKTVYSDVLLNVYIAWSRSSINIIIIIYVSDNYTVRVSLTTSATIWYNLVHRNYFITVQTKVVKYTFQRLISYKNTHLVLKSLILPI